MRATGEGFEDSATAWLQKRGWQILARNFYCRLGEIDSDEVRLRLRRGLVRRGECPVEQVRGLLEGDNVGARADAAWIAGAAGKSELAAAAVTAASRSRSTCR